MLVDSQSIHPAPGFVQPLRFCRRRRPDLFLEPGGMVGVEQFSFWGIPG